LSPLFAQGAVAALVLVALIVSVVEPHLYDLVWRRWAGAVVAAATRRSREEQQQATAAAERDLRIRQAMATIRTELLTWTARSGSFMTSPQAAALMASLHRGIAELRTEEPRVQAELDPIMAMATTGSVARPEEAQAVLAALEAKLRGLK
jgi:hypothetical protein